MQDKQKPISRRKALSVFAAFALVVSMVIVAPSTAFADITAGNIGATTTSITTTVGATTNIGVAAGIQATNLTPSNAQQGVDYHFDYQLYSGSGFATVNKHSGILTANAMTALNNPVVVRVYLTPGAPPSQNQNNPCFSGFGYVDISVTINGNSGSYGAQGQSQTVYMNSPTVTSWSGDNTNGFVNQLGPQTIVGGTLNFDFTMAFGTGNNLNNFENTLNPNNVVILNSSGNQVLNGTLGGPNLTLSVLSSNNNLRLTVNSGVLSPSGTYTLRFTSGFIAGNQTNTLGVNVDFVFSV